MKSAVEILSPTRVKLTVEVPFEELKPSLDKAYKTISQQIQVPGFRKGKVPNRIIEQRIGRAAVLEEAVNEALPRFYEQALMENAIVPLSQPDIDEIRVPAEDGEEFAFSAELDKRPDVEVPDFSTFTVEVDPITVADEDVAARLEGLRERFGTLKPAERAAQHGDFVSIDLSATIGGEEIDSVTDVSYEVGSKEMLEGLDDAVTGLSVGESKDFEAELAGGDREGETASCTVTVNAVKVRELPELDDEFAQLASEFDTLEELKSDLAAKEAEVGKYRQGLQARDKVMEAILESLDIPVPDALVEEEVHQHLEREGRLEDAEHRAEVGPETRKTYATQFLLDAVVAKENITVEQNDFVEYLVTTAQQYGMSPEVFARAVEQQGQITAIIAEVGRRKALNHILGQITVKDTEGNIVDLSALTRSAGDGAELSDALDEFEDAEASHEDPVHEPAHDAAPAGDESPEGDHEG